jgi:hypothetical protein
MMRTSRRSYLISPNPRCVFSEQSIMVRIISMTQAHQLTQTAAIKINPSHAAFILSYPMPHTDTTSPSSIPIAATNITVFHCIFIVIIFTPAWRREKLLDNLDDDIDALTFGLKRCWFDLSSFRETCYYRH